MTIEVETIAETPGWDEAWLAALAERAVRATAAHLALGGDYEVAVLGCDDARIAALNADFRGKARPTNVLSWPASEIAPPEPGAHPPAPDPGELGDIAISWETTNAEAEAGGIPLEQHVTHLLVHAALHLLGYDHETDADGDLMESLETEILCGLGLPDPYA